MALLATTLLRSVSPRAAVHPCQTGVKGCFKWEIITIRKSYTTIWYEKIACDVFYLNNLVCRHTNSQTDWNPVSCAKSRILFVFSTIYCQKCFSVSFEVTSGWNKFSNKGPKARSRKPRSQTIVRGNPVRGRAFAESLFTGRNEALPTPLFKTITLHRAVSYVSNFASVLLQTQLWKDTNTACRFLLMY